LKKVERIFEALPKIHSVPPPQSTFWKKNLPKKGKALQICLRTV